jgi:hypothetical protein
MEPSIRKIKKYGVDNSFKRRDIPIAYDAEIK